MAEPSLFKQFVFRNLERLERIVTALLILIVGARYFGYLTDPSPMMFGLIALGVVYYAFAFRPPAPLPEGTKQDFMGLLLSTILPKVLWISCAVGAMGLAFYFNESPGAKQMLVIQTATGLVGVVLWGIGILRQDQFLDRITTPITRALPLMLIAVYILLQ